MESEQNLLDYVYVLVKWRRLIGASVAAVSLAAAGVALVLPKAWTATTRLLPPAEESGALGLSELLISAVPGNLDRLVGQSTSGEHLLTLLESRRVLQPIVERFGLMEEYGTPYLEQAIATLDEHIDREVKDDGTLTLTVSASSPERAADMANELARRLDEVNREHKRQQAAWLRGFLAERLEVVRGEFEHSALALRHFQEEHGLVDIEAQTQAAVEVVKSIVQELTLLEVKAGMARRQLRPDNEKRRLAELEVEELRKRLQTLVGALAVRSGEDPIQALGPPLQMLPKLGSESLRLELDLKIKEEIIRFLGTRLEEAKYREALNTPTIQVLDRAIPPEMRSAPRRVLIVLVAAAMGLVMSTVLAFVFESLGCLEGRNQAKVEAIKRLLHPQR